MMPVMVILPAAFFLTSSRGVPMGAMAPEPVMELAVEVEREVMEEAPAAEVARELGISAQDVYMAKNRVAERLRGILARLDELFDDG